MPRRLHSLFWFVLSAALLTGCASQSGRQDYLRQAESLPAEVSFADIDEFPGSAASLNALIDSRELQSLVQEALDNNPGLQQTLLALQQSQATLRQRRGERYPELEAGISTSDTENSEEQYTGSLTLSWQLDVWQQIEDGINADEQSQFQQQATYQSVRDTLAAEVMSGWLDLVAQKRSLDIERRRLNTLELNEQLIQQRYQRGLGSLDDLDSARSLTYSTLASVRELEETIQKNERALNSLLGRMDENPYQVPDQYPSVERPLTNLPEQTLARRPDLQAAWYAIAAADYNASVAYKDLLPRIDIQAALEDVATSPMDALLTDPVWSLLGQLTMPLFQGGQLYAAAEIATLDTAIQYERYRETLLTAVEEVRNALGQERAFAERQAYIRQALDRQKIALERFEERYRAGNATILELLSVQQETYDLESQLDTLIYNQLDNRITLTLALGMGIDE